MRTPSPLGGRVSVGAARIDLLTHDQAVVEVLALAADHTRTSLVVTPNIDHVVRLESDPEFRSVYDRADLVLPDGWPVVLVAKMRGARRVGRVTGSDLVPAVIRGAAGAGLSVALVGGEAGSARGAADVFEATIPSIRLVAVEPARFVPRA